MQWNHCTQVHYLGATLEQLVFTFIKEVICKLRHVVLGGVASKLGDTGWEGVNMRGNQELNFVSNHVYCVLLFTTYLICFFLCFAWKIKKSNRSLCPEPCVDCHRVLSCAELNTEF